MPKYQRALRPRFTKYLYEKLKAGQSLNPFGGRELGCTRLLEDIQQIALEDGIKVFSVNLEPYRYNYKGFLKDIEGQMALPGQGQKLLMPSEQDKAAEMLPAISSFYDRHGLAKEQVFLIIKDLDAILGHGQHEFPKRFFDDLNSLRRLPSVSLCCLTKASHKGAQIFYDPDKPQESSWLELEPIDVPTLERKEIKAELHRLIAHLDNWKAEQNKERLYTAIEEDSHAYLLLGILAENYKRYAGHWRYKERLARCKKSMAKRYHIQSPLLKLWNRISYKAFKLEVFDWLTFWKSVAPSTKSKQNEA